MISINKSNVYLAGFTLFCLSFYGFIVLNEFKPVSVRAYQEQVQTQIAESKTETTPKPGLLRAQVALNEFQKNVKEKTPNCNCGTDVEKYTEGLRIQWCASFASWVSKEAGSPLGASEKWRIGKAQDIARYLEKNGTWVSAEDAKAKNIQPQVGDIVIFWRGHFEDNLGHADIVIATDPGKPGQATLIGGNIENKVSLRENMYYSEHYGFLGFGRPEK